MGALGPRAGAPIAYHWSIIWNLIRFLPWLVPIVLLVRPPNRRPRALAVAAPALALMALAGLGVWAIALITTQVDLTFPFEVFTGVVAALLGVWLLSGGSQGGCWGVVVPRSLAVMAVTALLGAIGASGGDLPTLIGYAAAFGAITFALFTGVVFGGILCKRRPSPQRFATGLIVSVLVLPAILGAALGVAGGVFIGVATHEVGAFIAAVFGAGLSGVLSGITICLILLTFLGFTAISSEYRARWRADLFPVAKPVAPPPIPPAPVNAP